MKSKPRRTAQDIRTMSERISETNNPQRKYLALAMLELEKARRNQERQSSSQRVANIDRRLAEIELAQTSLLAAAEAELGKPAQGSAAGASGRPGFAADQGFQFSY
jgi:hypothetical protein